MKLTLVHGAFVFFLMVRPKEAFQSCNNTYECMGNYKSCCDKQCIYRRYCVNFCASKDDCGPLEYCISSKCTINKPDGYCNYEMQCKSGFQCSFYKCIKSCDCTANERCDNGKCIKEEPKSNKFEPSSIIGFTAVVVIGSCIACAVYCGCARRAGRAPPQPQQIEGARDQDPPDADRNQEEQSNEPIHPGGPPPYHSIEMLSRTEELPPPPTYEEALRNSHNNLNV